MNKRELYESIMRNVANEVKSMLYEEKQAKSEELIAAESKLSQEEKVDLWINGKRNINLELCSPDKLRKYYKICQDKNFAKGVYDIEKVAKSRNIDLAKEVKESLENNNSAKFDVEIDTALASGSMKKGFMMYDPNGQNVIVYLFDTLEDLFDLYGIEKNDRFYQKVDRLDVGETIIDNISGGAIHTRIW